MWLNRKYDLIGCGPYLSSHENVEYSVLSKESPVDVLGDEVYVFKC